jgi:hypothetical protein
MALTLRLLGGLSTKQVASSFLVADPTMARRLVRAKRKVKAARIPHGLGKVRVWLVGDGRVSGPVKAEQARPPAIMWVSNPMTSPDRCACLPIIPHSRSRPAAGSAPPR